MSEAPGPTKSPLDLAKIIYETLEPLDKDMRERVLTSALSLLGMPLSASVAASGLEPSSLTSRPPSGRPLSPVELIESKEPSTNAQRIAVFAYYREKVEGKSRFSRSDLRDYFAKARLVPPQNYDRDFKSAVELGYIYEDASDSYLTSKGLEAVEAGFGGKALPRGGTKRHRGPGSRRKRRKAGATRGDGEP